jgi:hypothetical protein
MWIILFKCGQFYLSVDNILLKLKNISFDIMQFVNDINPQFVNYRLSFSSFFGAIAHVLFVYKKFKKLLSRHQFYSTKIHYTSQTSFKTKLFSCFLL